MFNEIVGVTGAVGAMATAVAVFVAWRELRMTKAHAQTSFEDDLTREYRALIGDIPTEAFFTNGQFHPEERVRRAFYRYADLCNEQLFLARLGRVSQETADQWRDGIRGNFERLPAFRQAWAEIASHIPPDFFQDLRELIPPEPRA